MIFAQIDPVLSMVKQDTLFNPTPEFITGSYMMAIANQYSLGSNQVNFRVSYGTCIFNGGGDITDFNTIHSDNVELSGEDIENWGTDDSLILDIIAEKQGTTVITVVSGSFNGGF
jgi:hypothetical protein